MSRFDLNKDKAAIIAGNGSLPAHLFRAAQEANGPTPLLIGIKGEVSKELALKADKILSFGQLGKLFELLNTYNVKHVVFAGGISKRPDLRQLKLDMLTLKELPNLLKIIMGGDNSVLSKISSFFNKKGITVVGAHEIAPQLLTTEGIICGKPYLEKIRKDAKIAFNAAKAIGQLDAGQAVIVEDGRLIALESAEGTDAMLNRVGSLRRQKRISAKPKTSLLAKTLKPGQDMRADLPVIGAMTILTASRNGIKGIVLEAGRSIILEQEKTFYLAKAKGVFIVGAKAKTGEV